MLITVKRPAIVLVLLVVSFLLLWQLSGDKAKHLKPSSLSFNFPFRPLTGIARTHNEVFSQSTAEGKYFDIDFGDQDAMNPNIIPHPSLADTWIVVAQAKLESAHFFELACNAVFKNDVLTCVSHAIPLPVAPTYGDKCHGDLAFFQNSKGPHDARVFYSPHVPYIIFGSNSHHTCFGQWIQDFRTLTDWKPSNFNILDDPFGRETEVQRPLPWSEVEKNWFIFWDKEDKMYAHYDIGPKRVFAELSPDGSVGNDLSGFAAAHDERCLSKYMPKVAPQLESVHQSTNSLSITMCQRSDKSCVAGDDNTFNFHIFQHKSFYNYHSVYEPYAMLFERSAPFKIHAMSQKPFWIHGRNGTGKGGESMRRRDLTETKTESETKGRVENIQKQSKEAQQSVWKEQMFYVTSMSWKSHEQKYHGYLDDVLFVAFGIEDERAGGIDVVAGDLLRDLGWC